MDYHNHVKEFYEWQGGGHQLGNLSNHDMPKRMLNGVTVTLNEEDLSYMFDESTPIKSCSGDSAYHNDNSEIMIQTPQGCKEYSSQIKRRRVLDFNDANNDISFAFLKSKERIASFDDIEILPEMPQWEDCLRDDFCLEDLVQSEAWIADCLVDTDMNISSDDGNASTSSDVPVGSEDACNVTPHPEPPKLARPVRSSRNIIFKGRKSYMRTPTKLASSVAYPFDFIKPCGIRGDVTLKDINQRILTPPPAQPKPKEEPVYPTSAFSGKPVVGKTRIPTQGGKGSITIMRTKG